MIIDISNSQFKQIFDDERLYLPIRWAGDDFASVLEKLYHVYQKRIDKLHKKDANIGIERIKTCCSLIVKTVQSYLNGFPADAFEIFQALMKELKLNPLKLYRKSINEVFEYSGYNDPLNLYRVVSVSDNVPYGRSRVFHTPYNLRSKVSTSRYSIAGYPSLYLGTSIELCEEEVRFNPYDKYAIASLFKLERNLNSCDTEINVIELALKPQDFFEEDKNEYNNRQIRKRRFDYREINNPSVKSAYLLWYPLIAACSFIRVNKSDPFAAEYIIPQLLMQWVRRELSEGNQKHNQLIGIRYFSCASNKASDMGFNYVFPTSGKQDRKLPFCSVLMKAFKLTKPVFIHEFENEAECERELKQMTLDNVKY